MHEQDQLAFLYDILITTHRDLADRLGSLIRMGWLKKEANAIKKAGSWRVHTDEFWATRSDLVVAFEHIERQPEHVILEIAHVLVVPANPTIAQRVEAKIQSLPQPDSGQQYDPLTLLHPGHKSDGIETTELAEWVRSVLADCAALSSACEFVHSATFCPRSCCQTPDTA